MAWIQWCNRCGKEVQTYARYSATTVPQHYVCPYCRKILSIEGQHGNTGVGTESVWKVVTNDPK